MSFFVKIVLLNFNKQVLYSIQPQKKFDAQQETFRNHFTTDYCICFSNKKRGLSQNYFHKRGNDIQRETLDNNFAADRNICFSNKEILPKVTKRCLSQKTNRCTSKIFLQRNEITNFPLNWLDYNRT